MAVFKNPIDWLKERLRRFFFPFALSPLEQALLLRRSDFELPLSDARSTSREIAEDAFSDGYHEAYFEHLLDTLCDFELLGRPLSAMLEDFFVKPSLVRPKALCAHSPERSEDSASTKRQGIWESLAAHRALLIIGEPGSGKTTLLKHCALTLSDWQKRLRYGAPQKFPLLLFLPDHTQYIHEKTRYKLGEAAQHAQIYSNMLDPPPTDWFDQQLKQGQCVVMLDGLDEVPDLMARLRVATWIEQQMDAYPNNHFVVTLRPLHDMLSLPKEGRLLLGATPSLSRSHLLSHLTALELAPFGHEQVQRFVEAWYFANRINPHNSSIIIRKKRAEELIELCSEGSLGGLVTTPLLLAMIATIHHSDAWQTTETTSQIGLASIAPTFSLPSSRVALYTQIYDLFLSSQAKDAEFELTSLQKRGVLQRLAYHMMTHKQQEIGVEEASRVIYVPLDMLCRNPKGAIFLQQIAQESGFLLQCPNGNYRFAHLSLQEQLAAGHIMERGLEQELIDPSRLEDCWWHETIRAYCARTDASAIITACLRLQKPPLSLLRLAIGCVQEARFVQIEVQKRLESILHQEAQDADPARRRVGSQGWLRLRLESMMPVNDKLYVADSLITNAEYQLFIDEQPAPEMGSSDRLLPHFPPGDALNPVIGLSSNDAVAFCEWLTERERQGWRYRLPYSGEFSPLVEKVGYWTQSETENLYQVENEPPVMLSISGLESRLRSVLVRDLRLNPDRALERIRQLDRTVQRLFDGKRQNTRLLALALVRDFTHQRTHDRAVDINHHSKAKQEPATCYVNFVAWLMTEKLLTLLQPKKPPSSWLNGFKPHIDHHRVPDSAHQTLAQQYFELYIDLVALEERTRDKLLSTRAIRIVAQRPARRDTQREGERESEPFDPSTGSGHRQLRNRGRVETGAREAIPERASQLPRVIQKKICILGDEGVGKTSLIRHCVEGRFDPKYKRTIGVHISRKTQVRPTYTMNMLLWDLEGGEGFKKVQLDYLRGATGALIVCDLTRRDTLAAFERFARQLRALNPNMPIVLIGNKVDLATQRAISGTKLEALSKTLGAPYVLTSAKTGTQVDDAFEVLSNLIMDADSTLK
ncbi:MAG: GTP-binding protein [Ardenticatenaceae bacterium]